MNLISVKVEDGADIVRLRAVGQQVVAEAGFAGFMATRIVTALLELGRNMIDHANGGRMSLRLSRHEGHLDLVLEAVDQGRGIADPERLLRETPQKHRATGLGLGLRGVRRMADRFAIHSSPEGTRVTAAFRTDVPVTEQAEMARAIAERVAQLQREDPAAMLAQQNRDLMEALEQRDMLLAEVHHRTKNNLSLVLGLMRLSRNSARSDEAKEVLRELEGRIAAIARVHDQLQRSAAANTVELMGLLRDVARHSGDAFGADRKGIRITVEGAPLELSSSAAVDLSLVVGELITNACKHAFEGRHGGRIRIVCAREGEELHLTVADDGNGLSEDADRPERSRSLGWQMVRAMVQKHGGTLRTDGGSGLTVSMVFNTDLMTLEPAAQEGTGPAPAGGTGSDAA